MSPYHFCKCPGRCPVSTKITSFQSVGYSKSARLSLPQFPCLHISAKTIFLAPEDLETVIIQCL